MSCLLSAAWANDVLFWGFERLVYALHAFWSVIRGTSHEYAPLCLRIYLVLSHKLRSHIVNVVKWFEKLG